MHTVVKWIRRNQRKLMAFVVIFIMIAFVGGAAFQQIMSRIGAGGSTVAYFGEKGKIAGSDILRAQSDLSVLRMLMFDRLLYFGLGDLPSRLLGQLLFPDSRIAAALSDNMKQAVIQGRLRMSTKDIDTFFSQATGRSEFLWILLKAEAKQAGCITTNIQAKQLLRQIVPQLTQGQTDAKRLVDYIIKNHGIPERQILRTTADLWSILAYTKMITSNENITISEVRAAVGREGERINAEFVKINASDFVAGVGEPAPEELTDQFERYKEFPTDRINDRNPYGFGYRQPARIVLEYLILKLDDVQTLIAEPTPDETEAFYQQNLDLPDYQFLFKYEEPADPNDPASTVQKTRSYAEVAGRIERVMTQDRTNRQADMILNEAIALADTPLTNSDAGRAGDVEPAKTASSYNQAAAKLSEEYKIKVYAGQTGLLSAAEVAADTYLGRLTIEGQNQKVVPLVKAVFAIDELGAGRTGPLGVPGSKMWQSIGPARDMFGSIVAIVRVIQAETATEPADLYETFNKNGVILDENEQTENIYSVRDQVARDIKLQKAMSAAGSRASELVQLIDQKGDWTEALDELNRLYYDPNDPLYIMTLSQQTRLSEMDIEAARVRSEDNPAATASVRNIVERKKLLDELYSLIPEGKTEATNLKSVIEFKPGACYYVIKNVSRTAVTRQDYQQKKAQAALMLDTARAEKLSFIHLGPDNIFKRMNYRAAAPKTDNDSKQPTGAP